MAARNAFIDVMRAVGIILVVYGHTGAPGTNSIYLFHMPLFMMLSGFCYSGGDASTKSFFRIVRKKIRSLYVPYLKYMLFFLVLHNLFTEISLLPSYACQGDAFQFGYYSLDEMIMGAIRIIMFSGGEQLGSALWFLRALFIVSVVYSFIELSVERLTGNHVFNVLSTCSLVVSLLGWVLSGCNVDLPLNIASAFSCIGVFHLGRCMRHYSINPPPISGAISAIVLIVFGQVYSVDISQNLYPSLPLLIVFSVCGWCLVWQLARVLNESALADMFRSIGRNTLPIMAFHLLCFKPVSLLGLLGGASLSEVLTAFPVYSSAGLCWFPYLIAGVFLPLCLDVSMRKAIDFVTKKGDVLDE